jgi:uncharacterized protein Yka (UPF0111/DUF47 family)
MDQSMMSRLEEHLREITRQIGWVREEMGSLKEELRGEMASFKEETTQKIEENSGQIEELREEVHLSRILQEQLRSDVTAVAEGVVGMSERLDFHRSELQRTFQEVADLLRPAYKLMGPQYQKLDRRVGVLEERADRVNRDVLQVIRKKFGTR